MERIDVQITPEDFRSAERYGNQFKCPLACALKRQFPKADIVVGMSIASIRTEEDGISHWRFDWNEWGSSLGNMSVVTIERLTSQSKKSLEEIPTVSLILTPY